MDCLIVVGTALATSGARSIVFKTLNKQEAPVIELNMEPQCDVGWAMTVTEKCETALPKLFNEYYRLIQEESRGSQKSKIQEKTAI